MENKTEKRATQLLKEAAETLGVTYRNMLSYIYNGTMPAKPYGRVWFFKASDLKNFVDEELNKRSADNETTGESLSGENEQG